MEEKIVKTINGAETYEKNCRLINGEYYLIGNNKIENSGDVYLINNRYIRATTKMVVFDHFEQEYKYKNSALVEGIIGTDGDEIVRGFFSKNPLYNVKVILKDKTEDIAISSNVLKYAFRERKSSGVFYHISLMEAQRFNDLRGVSRDVKESFHYDAKSSIDRVMNIYNTNYNPVISQDAECVGRALKHYTFGLEFETSIGIVPNNKLAILPLIPLRDGSIDGIEYATVPLQGPKGVQAIVDCVDELERRTDFNIGCSLHIHIGGMPRTTEFILAFYKFMSYFQDEIFSLFPIYKKYNFGIKRKNYSAPFPFDEINFKMDPVINTSDKKMVTRNFNILFKYLSGGVSFEDYNNDLENVHNHPQDPNGNQKWNIKHRYSYINFIPLIFGNKQTIEFRIHTPTYNSNKIIDFLMLNTFLIDYVALNTRNILNGTDFCIKNNRLGIFIDAYIPKQVTVGQRDIYSELSNYISERRHRSESLAREYGISYPEELVRPAKYLKLTPYRFIKKSEDIYSLGSLSFMSDELVKGYFSMDKVEDLLQEARKLDIRTSEEALRKKPSPKKSIRRSASMGESIKYNGDIGRGLWFSSPVTPVQEIPTPYIPTSSDGELKSKVDEDNIF